ncbi:MAG: AAA family ATPase [Acidimicrobiales bacterium]
MSEQGLFADVEELPNDRARERFVGLVGLDSIKIQLVMEARALLDPSIVEAWSKKLHNQVIPAVTDVMDRTPLVVLEGDVGTGKTELAETVGDPIGRDLGVTVMLYPMSLSARGHGAVGEMTTLLTKAFEQVREYAQAGRGRDGNLRHATILLIDEADALAQSRELAQMHHEDRAGVNALIRGIDGIRRDRLPVLTIMCTNRIDALDPAVRRRAAAVFQFSRPDEADRRELLKRSFSGVTISDIEMDEVVRLTGPVDGRIYGCTFSDLRQRFVPSAVLQAVSAGIAITGTQLIETAKRFQPTRPFEAEMVERDG